MEMLIYLCVAERKIDSHLQNSQFFPQGYYSPYRLNASNKWDESLLAYVNVSIPKRQFFLVWAARSTQRRKYLWARQLKYEIKYKDIQIILFEISLRK